MSLPNILLVVLDSVRARNCGIYGHENRTTPFLSDFANEATLFTQARSPSIHSIASHASLFSGHHVEEHRLTDHASQLDPEANVWTQLKEEYEYTTGIFTPNVVISEASNLTDVFEYYSGPKRRTKTAYKDAFSPADLERDVTPVRYLRELIGKPQPMKAVINGLYYKFSSSTEAHDPRQESGDVYVTEFLEWAERTSGSWAACLNLMDAHYPYVPDEQYDRWGGEPLANVRDSLPNGPMSKTFLEGHPWGQLRALEALYDGCIRQLDAIIKQLITGLKRLGAYDDTLIVITSDHGEGFGERSLLTPEVRLVDHSWGISEELTHVPLLLKEPTQTSGRVIDKLATLTQFPDVVSAAIAGRESASEFLPSDGTVLSSTYRIVPPGEELPLDEPDRDPYFGPWRALYREDGDVYKFAQRGEDGLTAIVRDAQVSYVIDDNSRDEITRVFDQLTDACVRFDTGTDRDIGDDVENRLEDLGYLR